MMKLFILETLKDELMLKRAYRLDKELRGNYIVIVYCDDESYSNEFKRLVLDS
jgi:hypothetical protein